MIFIKLGLESIDLGLVSKWFFSSRTIEFYLPPCGRQHRKPGSWVRTRLSLLSQLQDQDRPIPCRQAGLQLNQRDSVPSSKLSHPINLLHPSGGGSKEKTDGFSLGPSPGRGQDPFSFCQHPGDRRSLPLRVFCTFYKPCRATQT